MEIGIECGRHLLLSISDDDLSIARKGDYIEAARAIGHCLIERRITPAHRFGDGDKIRIALGVHKDHEKLAGCPDSAPGLCTGRQANDHDLSLSLLCAGQALRRRAFAPFRPRVCADHAASSADRPSVQIQEHGVGGSGACEQLIRRSAAGGRQRGTARQDLPERSAAPLNRIYSSERKFTGAGR
jgi:hypothetical protein